MDHETSFLYHFTPLLLVSGLGGSPLLRNHPLQQTGDPLAVRPTSIDHPVAQDLHGRFSAKSNDHKLYEHLAPKASKKNIKHLLSVRFIDETFKLVPTKTNGEYSNGQPHSALSPRNPHSDLYPDGVISVQWIEKYLYLNPGMALSFHLLGDTSTDDQLIKDLNALKSQWLKRNVRFVAVVIGENVSEDRISHLRRSTGLEKRTGMFFVPTSSNALEKETLVEQICQLAYTQGLEYYSALVKKIRKKRGSQPLIHENVNPEGSTASLPTLPLSSAGWESRYSFKTAVLAEFRQDLDSALRSYEVAYENIMELLETYVEVNERWSQALQLVDVLAYKMYKICLYIDQPNVAYRKFEMHLRTVLAIANETLDKPLWKAKQYLKLAQLVELTDDIKIDRSAPLAPAPDEYTTRLPRCGFLYLRAVELMKQSSSSGQDLENSIFDALSKALKDFDHGKSDHHRRSVSYSLYQHGEAMFAKKDYPAALKSFDKAAETYRQDGWRTVLIPILERILKCAKEGSEEYNRTLIELNVLDGRQVDLSNDLEGSHPELRSSSTSPLSAKFAFGSNQLNIGLAGHSQLTLQSKRDWTLEELKVEFDGLPDVTLHHDKVAATEGSNGGFFTSNETADLAFVAEKRKVFEFTHVPKDLGKACVKRITAIAKLGQGKYKFDIPILPYDSSGVVQWVVTGNNSKSADKPNSRRLSNPHAVEIAPRPAKIKMQLPSHIGTAAAGESLAMDLSVNNQEQSEISLKLAGKVTSNEGKTIDEWTLSQDQAVGKSSYPIKVQVPTSGATGFTIEVAVSYTLKSGEDGDGDNSVIKDAISMSLPIVKPFRVNFDVSPRPHPDQWPSSFIPQQTLTHAPLISKRWNLTASLLFLLGESNTKVVVVGSELELSPTNAGEAVCTVIDRPADKEAELSHNQGFKLNYLFDTCRGEKEIRSVAAEAYLCIKWRRSGCEEINQFHIPVVRLNLPLHEPRVILDCERIQDGKFVRLTYYIENATSHILTYSVSMSSSSMFAYQGPKLQTLRVLPYTRRAVEYTLLPVDNTGAQWLKIPQLRIHDTYFKRTLVIVPASGLLRSDKSDLFVRALDSRQ